MYFNIAISIHAVLWDRDNLYMQDLRRDLYFNPRGPLGPRRVLSRFPSASITYFNPRGPLGPRRRFFSAIIRRRNYFNPRGPLGPRLNMVGGYAMIDGFQSTRSSGTAT